MPKQLADVEGERLLDRTVCQLNGRGVYPIVVGYDERLNVENAGFWTPPRQTRWLVETIALSEEVCDPERTIGLFGDAFFTDDAMDTICQSDGLKFFGRHDGSVMTGGPAECFGWAMNYADHPTFFNAVQAGVRDADEKNAGAHGSPIEPGAIWQPYRLIAGFDMYDHRVDDWYWETIDDWTDDFDTPERYNIWLDRYSRRWVQDNG